MVAGFYLSACGTNFVPLALSLTELFFFYIHLYFITEKEKSASLLSKLQMTNENHAQTLDDLFLSKDQLSK